MGLRMKKYNILVCSLKNPTFRRMRFTKNQYRGGNCLKREGLGQFADLREGGVGKKEGVGVSSV